MSQIVVASTNPVKIAAALDGFQRMFPARPWQAASVAAPSGVAAQPMSDDETRQGARGRVEAARQIMPDAAYWIGIEGGCAPEGERLQVFAWVVVTDGTSWGESRSAMFYLPDEAARLVLSGMELGAADDVLFGRANSKQQNGSVGLLTGDIIDRKRYYEEAVVLSLIPFKNPQFTFIR